jgi:hypothetical protein
MDKIESSKVREKTISDKCYYILYYNKSYSFEYMGIYDYIDMMINYIITTINNCIASKLKKEKMKLEINIGSEKPEVGTSSSSFYIDKNICKVKSGEKIKELLNDNLLIELIDKNMTKDQDILLINVEQYDDIDDEGYAMSYRIMSYGIRKISMNYNSSYFDQIRENHLKLAMSSLEKMKEEEYPRTYSKTYSCYYKEMILFYRIVKNPYKFEKMCKNDNKSMIDKKEIIDKVMLPKLIEEKILSYQEYYLLTIVDTPMISFYSIDRNMLIINQLCDQNRLGKIINYVIIDIRNAFLISEFEEFKVCLLVNSSVCIYSEKIECKCEHFCSKKINIQDLDENYIRKLLESNEKISLRLLRQDKYYYQPPDCDGEPEPDYSEDEKDNYSWWKIMEYIIQKTGMINTNRIFSEDNDILHDYYSGIKSTPKILFESWD